VQRRERELGSRMWKWIKWNCYCRYHGLGFGVSLDEIVFFLIGNVDRVKMRFVSQNITRELLYPTLLSLS
jgi:hypothetical protein